MHDSLPRRIMLVGPIVLALLVATSAATAVTAVPAVNASSADATANEAEAVRFRATFGFDSSLAKVRSAAADSSRYANMDYGVPLDAAEVAELARRATIQATIDPVVEKVATNETFAGMYLDQKAGGIPVFMFTTDISSRSTELSKIVPTEFGFRTQLATRTYKELETVNDEIASNWDRLKAEGIDIVRAGIRTDLNVVEVGVHGLTSATSKQIESEFGPGIVVVEDQVAQADTCNSVSDCRPMKGA